MFVYLVTLLLVSGHTLIDEETETAVHRQEREEGVSGSVTDSDTIP